MKVSFFDGEWAIGIVLLLVALIVGPCCSKAFGADLPTSPPTKDQIAGTPFSAFDENGDTYRIIECEVDGKPFWWVTSKHGNSWYRPRGFYQFNGDGTYKMTTAGSNGNTTKKSDDPYSRDHDLMGAHLGVKGTFRGAFEPFLGLAFRTSPIQDIVFGGGGYGSVIFPGGDADTSGGGGVLGFAEFLIPRAKIVGLRATTMFGAVGAYTKKNDDLEDYWPLQYQWASFFGVTVSAHKNFLIFLQFGGTHLVGGKHYQRDGPGEWEEVNKDGDDDLYGAGIMLGIEVNFWDWTPSQEKSSPKKKNPKK